MPRKKIIDNVETMRKAITQPGDLGVKAAKANTEKAIAAITGGIKSTAWRTYMEQFVSRGADGQLDQEQLDRLLAVDGTDKIQARIDNRAYLVSNGVCGQGTADRFLLNVSTIDTDLETDCNLTPEG